MAFEAGAEVHYFSSGGFGASVCRWPENRNWNFFHLFSVASRLSLAANGVGAEGPIDVCILGEDESPERATTNSRR